MLESIVSGLLNQYLGAFVENLDGSQLKIGLFSGKLTLRNVAVRTDALAKLLDLPIKVIAGNIGTINLDIPISQLRSKPIVVQADEVYLLAAPQYDGSSPVRELVRAHTSKLESLRTLEKHFVAAQTASGRTQAGPAALSGDSNDAQMFEGLLATAVSNLQLRVTRVHVRYEHPVARLPNPQAGPGRAASNNSDYIRSVVLGFSLAEVSVSTTNDEWVVEFVRGGDTVYKLGSVQGVSLYLDTVVQAQPFAAMASAAAAAGAVSPLVAAGAAAGDEEDVKAAALTWMRHIFEAQIALGLVDVKLPSTDQDAGAGSSNNASGRGLTGGGAAASRRGLAGGRDSDAIGRSGTPQRGVTFASDVRDKRDSGLSDRDSDGGRWGASGRSARERERGDARTYAGAYAYLLQPVSGTARVSLAMGYPLAKPKATASIVVDDIGLSIADRQYSMLLRVLTDHSSAWQARQLGLRYRHVLDDDYSTERAAASTSAGSNASSSSSRRKTKVPPGRTRARWQHLFMSLLVRYRASLRERERHAYLASITTDYSKLYMRRLTATELLGMPSLLPGERRRYEAIECDVRLSYDDVMALRRAAERWVREKLRMPLVDIQRRREGEVAAYRYLLEGDGAASTSATTAAAKGKTTASKQQRGGSGLTSPSSSSLLRPTSQRLADGAAPAGGGEGILQRLFGSRGASSSSSSSASPDQQLSAEDLSRLYDSLGYEVDPRTGQPVAKAGTDVAAAAAEAAMVANHGLPRSYVWLRLTVEVKRVAATLLEHAVSRYGGGVSGASSAGLTRGGGLLGSAVGGGHLGSLTSSGTLKEVTRLTVSRSIVGVDVKAASWAAGLDLGDVAVIDCGHGSGHRSKGDEKRSGGGGLLGAASGPSGQSLGGPGNLLHRYIIFSDHSRDGGSSAGPANTSSLARRRIGLLDAAATPAAAGITDEITESSICDEVQTSGAGSGAVAGRPQAGAMFTSNRFLRTSGSGAESSSQTSSSLPAAVGTGGGSLSANPVRYGLVSIRIVGNPDDEVPAGTGSGSGTAASTAAAAAGATSILGTSTRRGMLGSRPASSRAVTALALAHRSATAAGDVSARGKAAHSAKKKTTGRYDPYADDSDDDDEDAEADSDASDGGGGAAGGTASGASVTRQEEQLDDGDVEDSDASSDGLAAVGSRRGRRRPVVRRKDSDDSQDRTDDAAGDEDDGGDASRDHTTDEEGDDSGTRRRDIFKSKGASSRQLQQQQQQQQGSEAAAVWLRLRLAARPLVVVWSPPYVRRLVSWVAVADDLTSMDATYTPPAASSGSGDRSSPSLSSPPSTSNTLTVLGMLDQYLTTIVASASVSIEAALVSAKSKVDVKAFVAAPVLVVPQKVHAATSTGSRGAAGVEATPAPVAGSSRPHPCPMLVLDMGALTFSSRLNPTSTSTTGAAADGVPGSQLPTAAAVALPAVPATAAPVKVGRSGQATALSSPSSMPSSAVPPVPDPTSAVTALQPLLPLHFDRYAIRMTGISLLLSTRAVVDDNDEEYDPRLHHRGSGTGDVAIIQGAAAASTSTASASGASGRARLRSESSSITGLLPSAQQPHQPPQNARSPWWYSLSRLRDSKDDPWGPDALGTPRIAWVRGRARFLARNATLTADLHVNTSGKDFADPASTMVLQQSVDGGGGARPGSVQQQQQRMGRVGVTGTAMQASPASSSPSIPLPQVFAHVRLESLNITTSTADLVDIANIGLAAAAPFAEMASDAAAAGTGGGSGDGGGGPDHLPQSRPSAEAALALRTSCGIIAKVYTPFDTAPPEFFAFADPRSILKQTEGQLLAAAQQQQAGRGGRGGGWMRSGVGAGNDAADDHGQAASSVASASQQLEKHVMVLQMSVGALSLRLSHGVGAEQKQAGQRDAPITSSSATTAAAAALLGTPLRTPFDLILSAEDTSAALVVLDAGMSYTAAVGSLMAYVGAGSVPRALLLQLGVKVNGNGFNSASTSNGGASSTSAAGMHSHSASRAGAASVLASPTPGTAAAASAGALRSPGGPAAPSSASSSSSASRTSRSLVQVELSRAEVSLVRRPQEQLDAMRRVTIAAPAAAAASTDGKQVLAHAPSTRSVTSTATAITHGAGTGNDTPSSSASSSASSMISYASLMGELKADATYLFAPLVARVTLVQTTRPTVASTSSAAAAPLMSPTKPTPLPSGQQSSLQPSSATAGATTTTTRVLVRLGSALLSVSPLDAALLVALAGAVQSGITSVLDDVTEGLAPYLQAQQQGDGGNDGADNGGDGGDGDDGSGNDDDEDGDDDEEEADSSALRDGSFDPDTADAAAATLALSLHRAGIGGGQGAGSGASGGGRQGQAGGNISSAVALAAARYGYGSKPAAGSAAAASSSDAAVETEPLVELRLVCDRLQVTLYNNVTTGAGVRAGRPGHRRALTTSSSSSGGGGGTGETGMPSYRTQVVRLTVADVGLRFTDGSVSVVGRLGGSYFNEPIATWEPALDPWPFTIKAGLNQPTATSSSSSAAQQVVKVSVSGNGTLTLTASTALLAALPAITTAIDDVVAAVSSGPVKDEAPVQQQPSTAAAASGDGPNVKPTGPASSPGRVGQSTATQANTSSGSDAIVGDPSLAYAPFILVNDSGMAVQVWRPAAGTMLGQARVFSESPSPAVVGPGGRLPVSATYLSLLDQDDMDTPSDPADGGDGGDSAPAGPAASSGSPQRSPAGRPRAGSRDGKQPSSILAPEERALAMLSRAVPPPESSHDAEDADVPLEFQVEGMAREAVTAARDGSAPSMVGQAMHGAGHAGHHHTAAAAAASAHAAASAADLSRWYKPADGAAPTDVITGNVSVAINLQLAGYKPLVKQPISRTGRTQLLLQPLAPRQATHRKVRLLRAGAQPKTLVIDPHASRLQQPDGGIGDVDGTGHSSNVFDGEQEDRYEGLFVGVDDDGDDDHAGGDDGEEDDKEEGFDADEDDDDDDYPRSGRSYNNRAAASSSSASGNAAHALLRSWRDTLSASRQPGSSAASGRPLYLELSIEKGPGGSKMIRLRSLAQVVNSTRIPVAVRILPARPYGVATAGGIGSSPDAMTTVDAAAGRLAAAMRLAVITANKRKQQRAAAAAGEAGEGSSSPAGGRDRRSLFTSAARNSFRDLTDIATAAAAASTSAGAAASKAGRQGGSGGADGEDGLEQPADVYTVPCWDAATGGLPLDRVILPGQSFRLPLPYASNSRIFIRPAIQLPADMGLPQGLLPADDGDDGRAIIRVPAEVLQAEAGGAANPGGRGQGARRGSTQPSGNYGGLGALAEDDEDRDNEDDDDDGARHESGTPDRRGSFRYDRDVDEGDDEAADSDHDAASGESRSQITDDLNGSDPSDDDDDEEEDELLYRQPVYLPDPRYDWSLFEAADPDMAATDGDDDDGPGMLSSALGKLFRRDKGSSASQSASTSVPPVTPARSRFGANRDATGAAVADTAGSSVGLDVDGVSGRGLTRILAGVLKDGGREDGEESGSDGDEEDYEGSGGVHRHKRSHMSVMVAVCPRSRNRDAATAAINTSMTAASSSAGLDGGLSDIVSVTGSVSGASVMTASLAAAAGGGSGGIGTSPTGTSALVQSNAFYYLAARTDLVPLAGVSSSSSSGGGGGMAMMMPVAEDGDNGGAAADAASAAQAERLALMTEASSRVAAALTCIIRAPAEVQNALACDLWYEIAVPRWMVNGTGQPPERKGRGIFGRRGSATATATATEGAGKSDDKKDGTASAAAGVPASTPAKPKAGSDKTTATSAALTATSTESAASDASAASSASAPTTPGKKDAPASAAKKGGFFSRFGRGKVKGGGEEAKEEGSEAAAAAPSTPSATASAAESASASTPAAGKPPLPPSAATPSTTSKASAGSGVAAHSQVEQLDDEQHQAEDEEDEDDEEMVVIGCGRLGPAQSLSLLYAHPDPPFINTSSASAAAAGGGGGTSRSRYKNRLTAARYVRALSMRIKLPDTGFGWSPWLGLWTGHGSSARQAATTLQAAAYGTVQVLPPLAPGLDPASGVSVSPLRLRDGTGEVCTLHAEHAALAYNADGDDDGSDLMMVPHSRKGKHSSPSTGPTVNVYTLSLSLFCKFWLVNATGLPLVYSTPVKTSSSISNSAVKAVRVAPGQAQPMTVDCYENERFLMMKWGKSMLPTDRQPWGDRYGHNKTPTPLTSFKLPSRSWSWVGGWSIDMRGDDVDAEGWQYGVDFPRGSNEGTWSSKRTPLHSVRRRRWVRTMRPPSIYSALAVTAMADRIGTDNSDAMTARSARSTRTGITANTSATGGTTGLSMSAQPPIAAASTLLAVGIYMYGPSSAGDGSSSGSGAELEACAVRVGSGSAWSQPFPLRGVGRPGLVVVREKEREEHGDGKGAGASSPPSSSGSSADAAGVTPTPSLSPRQYELAVSSRPCTISSGGVFRRTVLVTLSPRFLFVNHLDPFIAAAFRRLERDTNSNGVDGGGLLPASLGGGDGSEDPLDDVGVYLLQVAQAGAHSSDTGVSRPCKDALTYLSSISAPGGHGEVEYDVGGPLRDRLRLADMAARAAGVAMDGDGHTASASSSTTIDTSAVPLVLSVPPGEHAPFYWPCLPSHDDGTGTIGEGSPVDRVCFRVVRLMRKHVNQTVVAGGGDRRTSSATSTAAGRPPLHTAASSASLLSTSLAAPQSRTIVVPVTDWSGAVDLSRVSETPVRLTQATGYSSRYSSSSSSSSSASRRDVILRVSVRAHSNKGTAIVLVTSDGGLDSVTSALDEDEAAEAAMAGSGDGGGHGRQQSSGVSGAGATHVPLPTPTGIAPMLPLLWCTGVGEVPASGVRHRYEHFLRRFLADRDHRGHRKGAATAASSASASSSKHTAALLASSDSPYAPSEAVLALHPPPPPLYRIDNHTLDSFAVMQKGVVVGWDGRAASYGGGRPPLIIPPRSSVLFAWSEPAVPRSAVAAALLSDKQTADAAASDGSGGKEGRHGEGKESASTKLARLLRIGDTDGGGIAVTDDDRLRLSILPTTVAIQSSSQSSTSSTTHLNSSSSSSSGTLEMELSNFASTCSLELPPGRVADEDAAGSGDGSGTASGGGVMSLISGMAGGLMASIGQATPGRGLPSSIPSARPLCYGSPVLIRSRVDGRPWAVGNMFESSCQWPIAETDDGWYSCIAPAPNRQLAHLSVWPSGSTIYAAQVRLGLPEDQVAGVTSGPAGGGDRSSASSSTGLAIPFSSPLRQASDGNAAIPDAASALAGVPFVFESANSLFGYAGINGGAKANGRDRGRRGSKLARLASRARSSSLDAILSKAGPTGAADASNSGSRGNAPSSPSSSPEVRYGDLVLVRHDALAADGDAGTGVDGDDEGGGPGGIAASRSQPLYLVCHRDGKVDWVQKEAALAVSRHGSASNSSGTGKQQAPDTTSAGRLPIACSVFLVIGGKAGQAVKLTRSALGASTFSAGGAGGKGKGAGADDEDDADSSDDDDGRQARRRGTAGGSGGAGAAGFGLLPLAYVDRMVECAATGDAATTIRQCRIPALAPAPIAAAAPAEGAADDATSSSSKAGGRVMSAMQRRRLAARGIKVEDEGGQGGASLAVLPLPATQIPAELRSGVAAGLATIGSTLGDNVARQQLATLTNGGDEDGSDTQPSSSQRLPSDVDLASLLAIVHRLPLPSSVPPSCALLACPLTSQVLPKRIIAARVGFDGPTRVLTLQAHAAAAAVGILKRADSSQANGNANDMSPRPSSAPMSQPMSPTTLALAAPAAGASSSSQPAPPSSSAAAPLSLLLTVALPEVCVSIVDATPQELLLLTLEGVAGTLSLSHPYTTAEVTVQEVQIDNQLPVSNYPVVLARAAGKRGQTASASQQHGTGLPAVVRPFLQAALVQQAHRATSKPVVSSSSTSAFPGDASSSSSSSSAHASSYVAHFPYLSLLIQEVDVSVEEVLLRRLAAVLPPDLADTLAERSSSSSSSAGLQSLEGQAALAGGYGRSSRRGRGSSGGILIGADLQAQTASARGGVTALRAGWKRAATDKLAGSIVQAVNRRAAQARQGGPVGYSQHSSSSSSSGALDRILGHQTVVSLRRQVAGAADKAAVRMKRDMKRLAKQGKKTMVKTSAVVKQTTNAAVGVSRRTLDTISAGRGGRASSSSGTSSSKLQGISGPEVLHRRRRHDRQGMAMAAFASLRADGSGGGGGGGVMSSLVGGDDDSSTWASDSVDTIAALAVDTQWWWPSRLPAADVREPPVTPQLFVQHMVLNSIALNLSFMPDPLGSSIGAAARGSSPSSSSSSSLSSSALMTEPLSVALNALGVMTLSLNRAPVRLNGLELINVLAGPRDLSSRVAQHYLSSALSEVYKVLLSFDVLGNPVGVISALGSGVKDFFTEPMEGMVRSPAEFGKGLASGSVSLLKGTVVGVGLGVSSITASVGRGVATLAFDDSYVRDRAERAARQQASRPAHIGEGLIEGTKDLGRGIAQGIAGVVLDPLRGAEAAGMSGFVKGVGKGLTGLVVKPVAGVLDLATRATEGMVSSAKAMAGEGSDGAVILRRRPPRLLWGIDRAVIPVETLHVTIIAIMRRALQSAADQAEADMRRLWEASAANKKGKAGAAAAGSSGLGGGQPHGGGGGGGSGSVQPPAGSGSGDGDSAAMSIVSDLRSLVTGREAALRAALSNIATTYMHHILWPRSPYLLIITSRSVILARINRAALGAGRRFSYASAASITAAASQQVIHLCWQTPVVTHTAAAAAAAASLAAGSATATKSRYASPRSGGLSSSSAVLGVDDSGQVHGSGAIQAGTRKGRASSSTGTIAGHMMYTHLMDSVTEMCTGAAAATEATSNLMAAMQQSASGATVAAGSTGAASTTVLVSTRRRDSLVLSAHGVKRTGADRDKKRLRVRSGPLAMMLLDALVQKRLAKLCGYGPENPIFGLPQRLVDAMTIFVDPLPLHWGNAIATLANVRPDEDPQRNVQAVTLSLAYMDSAYTKYCRDRTAFLRQHPDLPGAGEADALAGVRGLEDDDLVPLFHFCMSKAMIDRPVMCAVLGNAWMLQHGLSAARDGFAMQVFKAGCEWAASVPLPEQ